MLSPNIVEVIKEQAYVGVPSSFSNVCKIYPLTIKEIVTLGTNNYNSWLGLLLLTSSDIKGIISEKLNLDINIDDMPPLVYLLESAEHDDMFFLELQKCFSTFVREEILLLPKLHSVLVGNPEDKRLITPDNYSDFQDILRIQNRKKVDAAPENESAIAREFRLKREKAEAAKRKQKSKEGKSQSLLEMFEIAETFGIDYQNKTLYAFYSLFQRYQAKEKWEQDLQMLCAGADSSKIKTKYWGESLEEK